MKLFYTLLFFLCITINMNAQYWVVKGTVVDSTDQKPLTQATVILLNQADSTIKVKSTDLEGRFRITGVLNGNYQLAIRYVGYKSFQISLNVQDKTIDLDSIKLPIDTKRLDDVTVEGLEDRVIQNGDTTEMIAEAFKVNPDATASDLLEKMPGITVQNGQVQAQGENVARVLVDGREFFGDDPNAALQNLPADIIERIQVYDQASDQARFTGFMDGETSKTLNIITKASMRNGEFGRAYAGAGTDETYNAGASINLFRPKSRTTILGQTNNINLQNFSTSDLLGVTTGGGRRGGGGARGRAGGNGGRGGTGGNTSDFLVGQQPGISRTTSFGTNYSFEDGGPFKISASYFFNHADNDANESLFRQFTIPENEGQTYDENSLNESANTNHRVSAELEYQINEKNSIIMRPRFTFQQNDGRSLLQGFTDLNGSPLNETTTLNSSDLMAYNFNNNLLWRHAFEKRGRSFSVNLNTSYNENTGEALLLSENIFFNTNRPLVPFNQESSLDQNGLSMTVNATYTEPLTERSQLLGSYRYGYQFNDSDKVAFDFNESAGDYIDLNPLLSNTFENNYTTHLSTLGYNLRGEKGSLTLRGSYQLATLDNEQTFPSTGEIKRTFENFIPNVVYRYRIDRGHTLNINYRARTNPPTLTQLQNVLDNSDPLNITTGNPALSQTYTHSATVRYNKVDMNTSKTLFTLLTVNYADNYIGNSTTIAGNRPVDVDGITLEPGARYIKPENLDGYLTLRGFAAYGLPFSGIRSNLNFTGTLSYNRTPERINGVINYAQAPTLGLGTVLSSNISENVDFTLSSNTSFSNVTNTTQTANDNQFLNHSTRLRLNLIFDHGIVFRSTINHTYTNGLSDGFNQNFVLWNAELGKKLLKAKGEIKLTVFDLLKENQNIQRTITGSYIQDSQTQIITQYFMLSFIYNIRSFKSGEAPTNQNQRFQEMRRRFGRGG
jgi:hypothetical protein